MFKRYTERGRRVIYFAREEALKRGAEVIETSDIALALTRDEHKSDCPFSFLYENAARIRTVFDALPITQAKPAGKDIPLAPTSKQVLAYAKQEADLDDSYDICCEHLLRGLLKANDGTTKKLESFGWNLRWVREKSKELQPKSVKTRGASSWRLRRRLRHVLVAVAIIAFVASLFYLHFRT